MLQNKLGEIRELLRLGSNVAGGVGVSGGEGRVGSGVVRFSSSAIEGVSFSHRVFFFFFFLFVYKYVNLQFPFVTHHDVTLKYTFDKNKI